MHGRTPRRMAKMILPAAITGCTLIVLVQYLFLPALVRGLTRPQIDWLRQLFAQHPGWVLAAMVMIVALLGAPVLLVARWAGRRPRKSYDPPISR